MAPSTRAASSARCRPGRPLADCDRCLACNVVGGHRIMPSGFSSAAIPQPPNGNGAASNRSYQELKTSLHRDLLNKIDLEKLTTLQDVRARTQVQSVIHDRISA